MHFSALSQQLHQNGHVFIELSLVLRLSRACLGKRQFFIRKVRVRKTGGGQFLTLAVLIVDNLELGQVHSCELGLLRLAVTKTKQQQPCLFCLSIDSYSLSKTPNICQDRLGTNKTHADDVFFSPQREEGFVCEARVAVERRTVGRALRRNAPLVQLSWPCLSRACLGKCSHFSSTQRLRQQNAIKYNGETVSVSETHRLALCSPDPLAPEQPV